MPCRPVPRNPGLKTRLFPDSRSGEPGGRRDHCVILTRATRSPWTFRKLMQATRALIRLVIRRRVGSHLFWRAGLSGILDDRGAVRMTQQFLLSTLEPTSDHRASFQLIGVGIVGILVGADQ